MNFRSLGLKAEPSATILLKFLFHAQLIGKDRKAYSYNISIIHERDTNIVNFFVLWYSKVLSTLDHLQETSLYE